MVHDISTWMGWSRGLNEHTIRVSLGFTRLALHIGDDGVIITRSRYFQVFVCRSFVSFLPSTLQFMQTANSRYSKPQNVYPKIGSWETIPVSHPLDPKSMLRQGSSNLWTKKGPMFTKYEIWVSRKGLFMSGVTAVALIRRVNTTLTGQYTDHYSKWCRVSPYASDYVTVLSSSNPVWSR